MIESEAPSVADKSCSIPDVPVLELSCIHNTFAAHKPFAYNRMWMFQASHIQLLESAAVSKATITWQVRNRLNDLVLDNSGTHATEVAIYTLSDPRDIRLARYVGQTTDPHRRYVQHINLARLWLPDETPWWVKSPKLRPLYQWLRELHRDERRLPVMMIVAWTDKYDALRAERRHIHTCLSARLPLLNREGATLICTDRDASTS